MHNKYIIKNLAPWMIDELMVLSQITKFQLILLRSQEVFYDEDLKRLKEKGVDIKMKPKSLNGFFRKLKIITSFLISNILKFKLDYNFIISVKSIYWFVTFDLSLFSEKSNIHAQFATQPALLALFIKKYFYDKPKYSFTFHAYDIYFKNNWFCLLVDRCESCFSISEYNIEYIENNYIKSDKIRLSRLGVFRNEIDQKTRSIPCKKKFIKLGVLSWFVEKKGIIYLLEAMAELSEYRNRQYELIIAGDGPLKEEYLDFIKKNNLHNIVKLIGKVKDEQKENFYKNIDLFVLPSISLENDQDGIPVVLMEAISYGLPIVSTNVSGIPEICINDYNGRLIQEKKYKNLIDAVEYIGNNPEKYNYYSKNSITLSEKYDIEKNTYNKFRNIKWL